jgi:hypothetical protein
VVKTAAKPAVKTTAGKTTAGEAAAVETTVETATVETAAMETAAMETAAMEAATATVAPATVAPATVAPATAMGCFGGYRLDQCEDSCHSGCSKAQAARCADALHVGLLPNVAAESGTYAKDWHAPWHAVGRGMKSGLSACWQRDGDSIDRYRPQAQSCV